MYSNNDGYHNTRPNLISLSKAAMQRVNANIYRREVEAPKEEFLDFEHDDRADCDIGTEMVPTKGRPAEEVAL